MKTLFTLLFAFFFSTSFAQITEYRASLNSGLFHFAGPSAESVSSLYLSDVANEGVTGNPFGSKNGLCFGLSLNVKRVERKNFIYGVDAGVELLQSKILIDTISSMGYDSIRIYAGEGRSLFRNIFFNVAPFAGYRFVLKNINCDLAGGFDIAYCVLAKEAAKATTVDGSVYATSGSRKKIEIDLRPRIQLDANYNRFGAYLGYSFGLFNYGKGYYGPGEAYARLFRFGLTYQLQ